MKEYVDIFKSYIEEVNDNIIKFFPVERITSKEDNNKYIYTLPCIKNKKHMAYFDKKTSTFYCLHCKYSQNIIELTANILNISEEAALYNILIKKFNYKANDLKTLAEYTNKENDHSLYYQINYDALKLFRENFKMNKRARKYAYEERKLTDEILDKFQVGSCDNSNLIIDNLSKIYSLKDLYDVGLIGYNKEQKQYYELFRNRLIFPILNEDKCVVGFGGRTLGSSSRKYLNTKTTPIFKKGEILYAIDKLDNTIYDNILVCEGFMDVITMYQHGISNVVGDLGTAITQNHLKLLSNYTNTPILMLDGDDAGKKAMKRTIEKVGKVDTVTLPDNLDPDDFLKKYSSSALIECIKKNKKTWGVAMKDNVLSMEGNVFENMYVKKQF